MKRNKRLKYLNEALCTWNALLSAKSSLFSRVNATSAVTSTLSEGLRQTRKTPRVFCSRKERGKQEEMQEVRGRRFGADAGNGLFLLPVPPSSPHACSITRPEEMAPFFFPLHVFEKNPFPSCCYTSSDRSQWAEWGEGLFSQRRKESTPVPTSPFSIPANDIEARQILIFPRIGDRILEGIQKLPGAFLTPMPTPLGGVESDST